ncbi:cell division protein FtsZ [Polyangium jinanense]|uniref:Cell division protein FtsZ n=1 Tax=Polyangium jinanense TaxID=2829994 RepID=A0A9X3X7R8_9BACT|nr:cell division protein FtsZ [Polyangium jinanense]MDC3959373.1 cell division protein FtsZ [Polyangium jinanense]MDC3985782.1 cell division protein FtsZ [Polyangium jinanense]
MSFSIEFADEHAGYDARIKVIGCGGSGGNAVNTMINFGLEGVEFQVVNTDAQALSASIAPIKVHIGSNVTRGLGAGADPEKGRKAALEDVQRLKELIQGADMVFVTAGMGGGTGTGAAPVIAQLAREEGCLTVGVVTKPFFFEGKQRARRAELGLAMLSEHVDTLITIPNQKLLTLGDEELSFVDAFRKADEVLYQAIKGISDLITQNGIVNVDFADVKTVMSNMGRALMGTGCAKGQGRARLAAEMAITSPLLDDISVEGAMGVLINVVGGPDMRMREIEEAATLVQEQAHEDANIIFGATIDETMGDMIKVTVIATGFDMNVSDAAQHTAGAMMPGARTPQAMPISTAPSLTNALTSALTGGGSRSNPPPLSAPQRSMPQPQREEPAYTVRGGRGAPAQQPAPASLSSGASGTPSRERATFVPPLDADWDTPAFQRRGQ